MTPFAAADYVYERRGEAYWFTWPSLDFAIGVDNVRQERWGPYADFYVKTASALAATGRPGHVAQVSLNLLSVRDKADFVKALALSNPEIPWDDLIEAARVRVLDEFKRGQPAARISEVAAPRWSYLVDPTILVGETCTGYGDTASSKSYLAVALAISVATGFTVGPFQPITVRPVLILDWETTAGEWRQRIGRVCAGLGIEIPEEIHYKEQYLPLADSMEPVRQEVHRLRAGLVIVDSIAYACGGDVTADRVLPFFNSLRSLGPDVSRWVISHISKDSRKQERGVVDPFGTIFVEAGSRSMWAIRKEMYGTGNEFEVSMIHKKGGLLHRPIGVRFQFEDPDGPVKLSRCDPLDNPDLAQHTWLPDRIRLALRHGVTTLQAIADEVGVHEGQVRIALSRMPDVIPLHSNGRANSWGLRARD